MSSDWNIIGNKLITIYQDCLEQFMIIYFESDIDIYHNLVVDEFAVIHLYYRNI